MIIIAWLWLALLVICCLGMSGCFDQMRWLHLWWLVAILLIVGLSYAYAHDPKRPDLDKWFEGLTSAGSLCCTGHDYKVLDDSDWDTKDNYYRVRLNGAWLDVPANAVVKEPNRFGRALVWINRNYGGVLSIRCFLPGTMT